MSDVFICAPELALAAVPTPTKRLTGYYANRMPAKPILQA